MRRREFLISSSSTAAATLWAPLVNSSRAVTQAETTPRGATGPLRVHPKNGRYFTDGSGNLSFRLKRQDRRYERAFLQAA